MASGRISGSYSGFQLNCDWSSSTNVSGNYSDVTVNHYLYMPQGWSLYIGARTNSCTCNEYKEFSSPSISNGGGSATTVHLGTTTHRVYHNSDGSKSINLSTSFNMKATISGNYVGSITASGTITLDNIPRQANVTGATDFNDESNPTISFNNVGGFRVNARLEFGGTTIQRDNISNTGSYTFSLTEAERNLLRSKCSGNSITVREVIATCIGGSSETHWSWQDKTMYMTNANPSFSASNISYEDTNSTIVAITGNSKHIVRNLSNLKVTVSSATAKKYASISKYEITFNGTTKTITSAGTVDFGKINLSSNSSVSVKVTDSRGNTTTDNLSVVILNWELPSANITAKRVNNYEDDTNLTIQVSISSVNSKNSIQSIRYRYKKATESSYSQYYSISNNQTKTVVIDKLYIWDFQVEIKDKFGTKTYNFQVAKGMPILMIDVDLIAVGVNCFPTKENQFAVNGYDFNDLHPINSIIETSTNNNPTGSVAGTWELLTTQSINGNTIYYWKRTS